MPAGEFDYLEQRLLLAYCGIPHVSSQINHQWIRQFLSGMTRDQWEKMKIESGEKKSVLNGLPASMPALTMAFRLGEKAAGVGFDWKKPGDVIEKIHEEVREIEQAMKNGDKDALTEEVGDLLFAAASLSRKLDIDPEAALKRGLEKFRSRFGLLEEKVTQSGKSFRDFSLEELEEIWQVVKRNT